MSDSPRYGEFTFCHRVDKLNLIASLTMNVGDGQKFLRCNSDLSTQYYRTNLKRF